MDGHKRSLPYTSSNVIAFPARGPFAVHVMREDETWLVTCRSHAWAHGYRSDALAEASSLAAGFGVAVKVIP
jgi:hypothetical protein